MSEIRDAFAALPVNELINQVLGLVGISDDDETSDKVEALEDYTSYSRDFETGGIDVKLVHSKGGGEGEGEYVSRIFNISIFGEVIAFVATFGAYFSNCGTEWDGSFSFVAPYEMITVGYEPSDVAVGSIKKLEISNTN